MYKKVKLARFPIESGTDDNWLFSKHLDYINVQIGQINQISYRIRNRFQLIVS